METAERVQLALSKERIDYNIGYVDSYSCGCSVVMDAGEVGRCILRCNLHKSETFPDHDVD